MKKWHKILTTIILIVLILLGVYIYYAWKHGGELLFDMKEVLGETSNNSYGIRNDVYDFFQQEVKKSGIPELNETRVRNLFLNFMKNDQLILKHFSNKSLSIELNFKQITTITCLFILGENDPKYNNVYTFFSKTIAGNDRKISLYTKVFLNTDDRKNIYKISDYYMNGKTLNPRERSPYYHPKLCDKFYDHVLTEEEFFDDL